jgi:hypothetical protein
MRGLRQMRHNLPRWGCLDVKGGEDMTREWHSRLWLAELLYLVLGFFNILFGWLGIIFFITPLVVAIVGGGKTYCSLYCGRGQLLGLLGGKLRLSRNAAPPKFLGNMWFRASFLAFFMTMFGLMAFNTYKVFAGAELRQSVTLLWTFKLPWQWADVSLVSPWAARFAFGLFGVMLTSNILGLVTMALFRPRSWCAYCPMGTMTQGICRLKHTKELIAYGRESEENRRAFENAGK